MREAMEEILGGAASPVQMAAFVAGLAARGETVSEVAEAARVLLMHARAVSLANTPLAGRPVVDTCGTGGDGHGTFNVSTLCALVVAGAGHIVAKHGNRSISSRCGSADLIEAWGISLAQSDENVRASLQHAGIAFLFAPEYHPAMRHVGPVRRELAVRTMFNILGPLINPARPSHQLLGVYSEARLALVTDVLRTLGTTGAWVVHGEGGLDEVSIAGETLVMHVKGYAVESMRVVPEDFGVARRPLQAITGGDIATNQQIATQVLQGEESAFCDAVVLNAAACLYMLDPRRSLKSAADEARDVLRSGRALQALERWRDSSRKC